MSVAVGATSTNVVPMSSRRKTISRYALPAYDVVDLYGDVQFDSMTLRLFVKNSLTSARSPAAV